MGVARPLDTGRVDSIGRTVRVSGDNLTSRADAPAPSDTISDDEFATNVIAELGDDPRWTRKERATQLRLTRLLDRVFTHSRHDVMLKGGMRRLAISPAARFTDDADAYIDADDIHIATADIIRSVESELGNDRLRYRHAETRRYDHHPHSAQLFFDVTLNGRPFGRASIDVTTKVRATQPPMDVPPVDVISTPLDRPAVWPSYATCDQVADKVAAIFEKNPATGAGSKRYHDLVDIELAAMTEPVTAAELRAALRVEFDARGIPFPDRFEVPDRASWSAGYRRETQSVPEMRGRQLGDALDQMSDYLDPVLADPDFTGRWDPSERRWLPASG